MPHVIEKIEGRFGSQYYLNLLQQHVRQHVSSDGTQRYLLHDRFPVHTCAAVEEWFRSIPGITLINLPANSPDLMPLLNVGERVVEELRKNSITADNKEEMWQEVSSMFESVCKDVFVEELFSNIPLVLKHISECGGSF